MPMTFGPAALAPDPVSSATPTSRASPAARMPAPVTFTCPLPADSLLFAAMTASAGLSELGETQLTLLSPKPDLKPEDLLGKPVTVKVQLRDDSKRFFHGYVSRFGMGAHQGQYFTYHATVHPWLWFLSRTADCRIFQELSVPDIVKKVFEDHGVAHFEFKLFRSYRKWVYCVQYRESDYHFVARLLEHEGIYWYFVHSDGQHKMVLVDSQSAHDAAPACKSLPYVEEGAQAAADTDCVSDCSFSREVRSGKVALTSYDFERPSTDLKVKADKQRSYALSDYEVFDFQGDYVQSADGTQWAEDRMDELQTPFQSMRAASNAQGIEVGRLLKLTHHPRKDQNDEFLVTSLSVHAQVNGYESGNAAADYRCEFTAIPATQQFRPRRRTRKPCVQGPQTALVVGPKGEELYTDEHGRVKVQFHWDRYGKKDESSSCWVRVSQPWAGKGWGGVSIPRIGQEVVVDFLEGDPDQPIITGRVYNGEQTPPFALPGAAVISGIKSKSHKASGYNELSMDDTAGKEMVTIHGQYDMATTVEHDQTSTVHNCRTDTVDVDDTESVGNNQKQTVKVNQTVHIGGKQGITVVGERTKTVQSNESLAVVANQKETVGGTRTLEVTGADSQSFSSTQNVTVALMKTESIGAIYALSVGAAMNHAVGAALMQEVGGAKIVGVGALSSENVGLSKSIHAGTNITLDAAAKMAQKAGASFSASAGSTMSHQSGGDYSVTSKAKVGVDAASELVLKCGSAQLILKSGGDIELKGSGISINGSGKIVIEASGDLNLKGSNINQNS
jgi:type VI secretion system secreted protein VgrG